MIALGTLYCLVPEGTKTNYKHNHPTLTLQCIVQQLGVHTYSNGYFINIGYDKSMRLKYNME